MTDERPQPPRPGAERPAAAAALRALRPVIVTVAAGGLVWVLTRPAYNPLGLRFEYALRASVVALVLVSAVAWWWTRRRNLTWGSDVVPAVVSAVAALTVAGSLHGTPFAPGGLSGDQAFRTAAITRYADTWLPVDFTFQGLPAFYAPAYFWVLGRAADLGGVEPWRMAKVGTVLAALAVPLVTYLLWRRLVPDHTAALIAVVPLAVENVYEPYSWLVLFAIVPWWLETVHGVRRAGRRPGHPLLLGAIGALLFLTYYYFFFIAALALVVHLLTEWLTGRWDGRQLRRSALVLAVAAAGSAVYWLPLAISMARAEQLQSLANRWFASSHPHLPLPMAQLSVTGVVALVGLGYLVWTMRREALSRGLLVLLVAAYGWYLLGAAAAALDSPLLSFRGKPLVPVILLSAGVVALVRLGGVAARRYGAEARRVGWALGIVLVMVVGQEFVTTVRDSTVTAVAHATALPDGRLPAYHAYAAEQQSPEPPAAVLHGQLDALLPDAGGGRPVLLSDRVDVAALYPYYGFVQWNAHYAHPAAQFRQRVAFLQELAAAPDAASFAAGAAGNRYDRIDAFVLRDEGDELAWTYSADAFPEGIRPASVRFPRELFSDAHFTLVDAGGYVIAVRR